MIEQDEIKVNGIRIHYAAAGPEDGELLVLLHGFPEFWYGWRKQMPYFAERGYRVVAPDQRGCGESEKPTAVSEYTYDKLGGDIAALIHGLGREKALVVGHDWGGAVAWWLAANRPGVCRKVAILNVPRPDVMARALKRSRKQLKKSWYIFFFQVPRLPEKWMSRNGCEMGIRSLKGTSRKGTFTDDDIRRYVEAWSRPGALRGMINWYRAALHSFVRPPRFKPVDVPLFVIWGRKDRFLGEELAEPGLRDCRDGRLRFIDEATHWVQHEEPERVNRELEEFFAR